MIKAKINPYEIKVYCFTNKDKYLEFVSNRYNKDEKNIISYVDGRTLLMFHNEHGREIVIGYFNNKIGTLVHECSHAILFLFNEYDLNPLDSCGEHFCYLQQKLFNDLYKKIK